ncbi:hypothetical protein CORC01_08172 [Colletotrichum orchidophilum]|uniref:Uncharacterized protein n=1 Tax=Colletotrichum orchidophilum TaxID=1209926 RepID=A0A1G4B595_9PEZI|nr:uncharacterized protein CORC01_08172 [Colletotrichum orchidophilum]OHE96574.1 hypothetical protein CORC01_08172 [Colletotrichum orchidophilum]
MKEAALHSTTWTRTDAAAISVWPARGRSCPAHFREGSGRCSRPRPWAILPFSVVGVVSLRSKNLQCRMRQ